MVRRTDGGGNAVRHFGGSADDENEDGDEVDRRPPPTLRSPTIYSPGITATRIGFVIGE